VLNYFKNGGIIKVCLIEREIIMYIVINESSWDGISLEVVESNLSVVDYLKENDCDFDESSDDYDIEGDRVEFCNEDESVRIVYYKINELEDLLK
jgi:hypothetical protein